jgi:hypothetical protein
MIPFWILNKLVQINIIIPYYHIVSDSEVLSVKHLYNFKKSQQFKEDLDFLLKYYCPINLFEIIENLKTGRELPKRAFLLTFDDGFREINDVIAPILVEKGIPATFFINSAFIDNKKLCYQHKSSILVENIKKIGSRRLEEKIKGILLKNKLESNNIKEGILSVKYQQKDILDEIADLMNVDFNDYLLKYEPYLTSDQIDNLIKNRFTIGAHSIDHTF